jgi:long-chain acyl-CoA synthetase
MYTSSGAGNPNSICISHANMVASLKVIFKSVSHHLTWPYIPEFLVEISMIFIGMATGFCCVKTLIDTSVRNYLMLMLIPG